jgi:hypothetical protein
MPASGLRESMDHTEYQNLLKMIIKHREVTEIQMKNELEVRTREDARSEWAAEVSLEAVARFNEDMQLLAMNAFQMEKLLGFAMQENKVVKQWILALEESTLKEESIIIQSVKKAKVNE